MRFDKLAGAALLTLAGLVSMVACSAPSAEEESSGTHSSLAGSSDNDHTAFSFFVGQGLTAIQAAAIVGNLDQESSMDPNSVQSGGPGRGIAQWSVNGRWKQENSFASQQGTSANDLNTQLSFVWQELSTNAAFGLAALQAATDLNSAVEIFQDKYEICGKCNNGSRVTFAQRALDSFGSEAGNTTPTTNPDGTPTTNADGTTTTTNPDGTTFSPTGQTATSTTDTTDDGPCSANGLEGECISTSNCQASGGQSTAGLCPGAANIQCCTFNDGGDMSDPTMTGGQYAYGDDDDDDDYYPPYGYAHSMKKPAGK